MRTTIRIFRATHYAAWVCALLFGLAPLIAGADDATPRVADEGTPQRVQDAALEKGEKKMPEVKDSTNALERVHAFVSGKVQGVGFRNFTAAEATKLSLTGWVRNLSDGRVELVAEGPAAPIEKLMAAVAQGPAAARVDKVERKAEPYTGQFKQFEVER
jgi:acylphosphatase